LAEGFHELGIGGGFGGGEVVAACCLWIIDEPFDGSAEVVAVNPADSLSSACDGSAEADFSEFVEVVEDGAGFVGEDE